MQAQQVVPSARSRLPPPAPSQSSPPPPHPHLSPPPTHPHLSSTTLLSSSSSLSHPLLLFLSQQPFSPRRLSSRILSVVILRPPLLRFSIHLTTTSHLIPLLLCAELPIISSIQAYIFR
ncbi:hypothetical protein DTO063F5_8313 [Paecilomyces variotii]|nr:hypothetical protein DTO063F5_8313 [Paecilomyces variotii]